MFENDFVEEDRNLIADLLDRYGKDEFFRKYYDAIWDGYQENKKGLDEYDAFFVELVEDELLSDRAKILKCLRSEKTYNLKLRELWRKYLIRFPKLKADVDGAHVVYEEYISNHIGLNPFWEFKFSYEDTNGQSQTDRICISNDYKENYAKGFHKFYALDRVFLITFLLKTWDKFDAFTLSKFKYDFFPLELLYGPRLFAVDEVKAVLRKMGVEVEVIKEAYEDELIEREVAEAEAIAKEAMEEYEDS